MIERPFNPLRRNAETGQLPDVGTGAQYPREHRHPGCIETAEVWVCFVERVSLKRMGQPVDGASMN
jgi:hypothetical protein